MKSLQSLLLAALACTGCIEFEKQTTQYRHYPQADTLVIWQQYEGIYGEDDDQQLKNEKIEQLASVLNGQRTFFFGNWITEYDASTIKSSIEEMKKSLENENPDRPHAITRRVIGLCELLLKNIRIENGNFYLNAQGKLSATQRITITNVGVLLREGNRIIRESAQHALAKGELGEKDPALVRVVKQAILNRMNCITLKGQRLRVQFPASKKAYEEFIGENGIGESIPHWEKLGRTIRHTGQLVIIEIGKVDARDIQLTGILPGRNYAPSALAHVQAKYGIEDAFNPVHAREAFFRQSDARYKK